MGENNFSVPSTLFFRPQSTGGRGRRRKPGAYYCRRNSDRRSWIIQIPTESFEHSSFDTFSPIYRRQEKISDVSFFFEYPQFTVLIENSSYEKVCSIRSF